jgi:acyl-[acyl-carrier-protein]-phospholipid O-acyltransferase/long-chain-fatty-acid--[acyl-carrier-protein] ligase
MFKQLMTSRRFFPLFLTQFLAAMNDNFLKQSLIFVCLFKIGGQTGATLTTVAGAVLMLPSFIFSAFAGELADKYDKAMLARRMKFAEILAAALAAAGFALQSVWLLFAALAFYGVVSALFGPIKYGLLPDHLKTEELAAGNALVESGTFIAILAGPILAGWAAARDQPPAIVVVVIMITAVACWLAARFIPPVVPAAADLVITRNPVTSTWRLIAAARADGRIWIGALIVSWFWLAGAAALSVLPAMITQVFGGTEAVITLAMIDFAIGVAIGSLIAARLSHLRPNLALVPTGGVITSIGFLALASTLTGVAPVANLGALAFVGSPKGLAALIELGVAAIGGGLFVVPSFAAVQAWAPIERRARVVAVVGVVSAAFIVVGSAAVAGMQYVGAPCSLLFALIGVANLIATALVLRAWGREGMRDFAGFLFKAFYRVEVRGRENIPNRDERMIFAPNHTSFLDGPLMHAVLPVDAAFAVDTEIAQVWWARPFMKMIRAYTVDPTRPIATKHLVAIVRSGEPLVIFPEGRLTVTGSIMKVYDGAAMIADKTDAWIVPVRIEGASRSSMSHLTPDQIKKALFPKITVTFLPKVKLALDPDLHGKARRQAAGAALQDVMIDAMVQNTVMDQTLFQGLTNAWRNRDIGRAALKDPIAGELTYRRLILAAQTLARKLAPITAVGENVGVMLPTSNAVAVTFFALQTLGRVPAMLNFSAGPANLVAACRGAEIKTILTAKSVVEKGRLGALIETLSAHVKIVYLEEIRAEIGLGDKLAGFLAGGRPRVLREADDPAVVLFTSGTEGTPKGVVLSHRNILANAAQTLARVDANSADKVFNALPTFHSFGLTGGLMMPLLAAVPVYLYPSPLHFRTVPELVYQANATILFGTDTFLAGYARTAHPYDFRSLRLVIAGGEPVKERTREIYFRRFGLRILEGYGVTETSPVAALNTPIANKAGTVGRLSPLMQARLEAVPGIVEGGRLHVSGPNVMLGYLRAERPGQLERVVDGWYDTGDIVSFDREGFITIKGRAKRFAKIAGEMVSLAAVESVADDVWPEAQSAAVSVPDAKKGERLVLLTTQSDAARDPLLRRAREKGLSELWVPATIFVVDQMPVLGTGKTDYLGATALAKARCEPLAAE